MRHLCEVDLVTRRLETKKALRWEEVVVVVGVVVWVWGGGVGGVSKRIVVARLGGMAAAGGMGGDAGRQSLAKAEGRATCADLAVPMPQIGWTETGQGRRPPPPNPEDGHSAKKGAARASHRPFSRPSQQRSIARLVLPVGWEERSYL